MKIETLEKCIQVLEDEVDTLKAELANVRNQLPEDMKNCYIIAKSCDIGHSWLTATNWFQHGCPHCENNRLLNENNELREQIYQKTKNPAKAGS